MVYFLFGSTETIVMIKKIINISIIFFIATFLIGIGVATWGYFYFSRDLPRFDGINNYEPNAVSSIYSEQGTLLAEVYEDRRYPVDIQRVPQNVINAFLASEDSQFYSHPGIDLISILRALYTNIKKGSASQGGSTITQQVVKNLLLSREKKLERKIKEAILAFKIENSLSKNEILELYLNQIYLGNTAYGIAAAAKLYFHKEVEDLDLAEASILAGLPKAPSKYSPIANLKQAKKRQKYVLRQMRLAKNITEKEEKEAYDKDLVFHKAIRNTLYKAPYYVSEVKQIFKEKWKDYRLETDGLKVYTALNDTAQKHAEKYLQSGLRDVDKRRGYRGRLSYIDSESPRKDFIKKYLQEISYNLELDKVYPALVKKVYKNSVVVDTGYYNAKINFKISPWSERFLDKKNNVIWRKPGSYLKENDVIEFMLTKELDFTKLKKISLLDELPINTIDSVKISQTPELQGAIVIIDPHTGKVLVAEGGYDYSKSQFNRVTQSQRQPGSAFKPAIYLAAIDSFSYTPSTIVYDEYKSFRVGDDYWTPGNFDEKFMGPITLRVALERSRNLVSADIISKIGIDPVIRYARSMRIKSKLGRNLSLSLGSSEVTPLEMTRAYGTFPAKGVVFDSTFITKIEDRNGNVVYDYKKELVNRSNRVVDEKSAFVMANLMKGVVQSGTGWKIKELKRPAAGKTGTSNDQMDAWFIGYTPEFACGVWAGFDVKKTIGEKETGGRVSAPIWLNTMKNFLDDRDEIEVKDLSEIAKKESEELGIEYVMPKKSEPQDFTVPDGVKSYWINKQTGNLADKSEKGAILEYYLPNTQPLKRDTEEATNYWEIDE